MDDQGFNRAHRERMIAIIEWIGICVIPVGIYLDSAHDHWGWVDYFLSIAWCSAVVRRIIGLWKAKAAN
jgi:hypothetical protein